jgi:toxin ParE1/3/4
LTSRSIRIHPDALAEAGAAVEWYKARSAVAAARLAWELDSLLARISVDPQQFAVSDHGTRRAILHRFPFIVVFREGTDLIDVVAIAHAKRRPGYWQTRKF